MDVLVSYKKYLYLLFFHSERGDRVRAIQFIIWPYQPRAQGYSSNADILYYDWMLC